MSSRHTAHPDGISASVRSPWTTRSSGDPPCKVIADQILPPDNNSANLSLGLSPSPCFNSNATRTGSRHARRRSNTVGTCWMLQQKEQKEQMQWMKVPHKMSSNRQILSSSSYIWIFAALAILKQRLLCLSGECKPSQHQYESPVNSSKPKTLPNAM